MFRDLDFTLALDHEAISQHRLIEDQQGLRDPQTQETGRGTGDREPIVRENRAFFRSDRA